MSYLINRKKYDAETKSLTSYFNQVFGILVFTISLTCLSFPNPQKAALFSLPIILALFGLAPKVKELRLVRTLIKEHDDEEEKKVLEQELQGFIKADSGFLKSLKQVPVYYYGVMFYLAVLVSEDFGVWFRT
ncbi:TPA: hypothetical protein ACN343_004492 [Vibrio parahaemolyticus]|uniref:hypothetical protein n=1 Tax=Vibrio TaxID=662 RepID=UPI0005F1F6A8|nr:MULTISPECIES: hypothetical protein [Vibrio]EGQ9118333.1 hypothetical protein [Vibrio parahaemolyticus]EGR1145869.1 hypothetical protein [Vibrio parahaemolyticus]EGR2360763.1 hypothetical protein [Vibrio parahaemolyticus]EHH2451651.1 hypothetical protein [Vibrio vulnificus]EHZ2848777.1 hypothetical protein [Vibrio vulnificus]